MALEQRQHVEGTANPAIHIGKRRFRDKAGRSRLTKTWWAEWCVDTKQEHRSLGVTNKTAA